MKPDRYPDATDFSMMIADAMLKLGEASIVDAHAANELAFYKAKKGLKADEVRAYAATAKAAKGRALHEVTMIAMRFYALMHPPEAVPAPTVDGAKGDGR